MRRPTPAQAAREAAGLSVRQVARKLRYSPEAVRLAERDGGRASYNLAQALAAVIGCDVGLYLHPKGSETPEDGQTEPVPTD